MTADKSSSLVGDVVRLVERLRGPIYRPTRMIPLGNGREVTGPGLGATFEDDELHKLAADALAAQATRIAELEGALNGEREINGVIEAMGRATATALETVEATVTELRAEVGRLTKNNRTLAGQCIKAERERDTARAALVEVGSSGVEFDDERLRYVTIQLDRDTWNEAVAIAKAPPTPG